MINFKRSREVKAPTRGHAHDAGLDFYIPEVEGGYIYLASGKAANIPSGIHIEIPPGFSGVFLNKSGVAKQGLIVGAQVIDCGYTGEVHLNLWNVSKTGIALKPGQKVAQMLIIPIALTELKEQLPDYEINTFDSERGAGGFGSTGV